MGLKNRKAIRILKRTVASVLAACALLCLAGCGTSGWRYTPVTDVNDLEGRRVAVLLSWEADYYLTGREDMEILRYDAVSDMLMAIKSGVVDVMAFDELGAKGVVAGAEGLELVEEPFGYTGYTLYFGGGEEALRDDFNAFLEEYKQTEAFTDRMERLRSFDGETYIPPEIELTGTGDILNVAIEGEGFPRTFMEGGAVIPTGFDVEALELFANSRNYQLVFYVSTYENMVYGLQSGLYDAAAGYLTDLNEEEAIASGLLTSEALDIVPLNFVQKNRETVNLRTAET